MLLCAGPWSVLLSMQSWSLSPPAPVLLWGLVPQTENARLDGGLWAAHSVHLLLADISTTNRTLTLLKGFLSWLTGEKRVATRRASVKFYSLRFKVKRTINSFYVAEELDWHARRCSRIQMAWLTRQPHFYKVWTFSALFWIVCYYIQSCVAQSKIILVFIISY